MRAVCQRCRRESNDWNIKEARFNVGVVAGWTVQLCEYCTSQVALVVLGELREVQLDEPATDQPQE